MTRRRFLAATAAFFVALVPVAAVPTAAAARAACPVVVAHGAGGTSAPQNTVAGITASAAAGAPMVEMDVRWSYGINTEAAPGYPVLMHDPTVDRTTNGTGPVDGQALGLTKLTRLSAADYAPWSSSALYGGFNPDGTPKAGVPHAGQFVGASVTGDVDMLLDVKVTPSRWGAAKLMQYIDARDWRARTIYMGSPASVTAMRGWYPDLRYAVIEYPPAGRMFTGEQLRSYGATIHAVPWDRVTPALTAYYEAYGIDVYTWTSDRPEWDVPANWARLRDAGVAAIITNEPAAAITTLSCTEGGS